MRTARNAGVIAALCLYGFSASASDGSLRGLRLPDSSFDADSPLYTLSVSATGLKRTPDVTAPNFAPQIFFAPAAYRSRRVATADYDYRISVRQPVGYDIAALGQGAQSMHDLLPRYTLHTQLTRLLPGGWGIGVGVRQTEYSFSTAHLLSLSAERSIGSFRGAYTLYSSRTEGATLGSAHRFEVSYLYGERNTVGLSYTTGRDIDHFAPPAALAISDVRDWTLSGRHWLSPNWALTYDLMNQEQGSGPLMRRQGLRLGVSRSF